MHLILKSLLIDVARTEKQTLHEKINLHMGRGQKEVCKPMQQGIHLE
jgi:hypothetical protein